MASDQLEHLYLNGVKANGKHIGDGAYGKVFEVEFCGTLYAAKEIHPVLIQTAREGSDHEGVRTLQTMFITECLRSSALGHQNVVQVLGVYNPGDQALLPVLVMEMMEQSLRSLVEKHSNIPMYVKLSMLLDVSRGLWYLHSHHPPIVHRDLSPNNVLLTSQYVAKISDLGVAKVIKADSTKTKTQAPGTVDFMPPEALQNRPDYGLPLDVFSYGGVILHVVNQEWPKPLHHVAPDPDPNTDKLSALSEIERRQDYIDNVKMTEAPADLQELVKQCLKNKANLRPVISEVSERIKRMKEEESTKHTDTDISRMMNQSEQEAKLKDAEKPPVIVQPPSQADIFSETMKVNWKEVEKLPTCGSGHNAVLLHGLVYVGGGSEEKSGKKAGSYNVHVYNTQTNQWDDSITTPCCDFAMTVLKDELVIAGGATTKDEVLNDISVLNTAAGQWKPFNKMPNARYSATAVGYQSMLIIAGGVMPAQGNAFRKMFSGYYNVQPNTELLDTASGQWHTCSNLPSPHTQLKAVIVNNTLYMLGGADSNLKPSVQVFGASLDDVASTHELNWQCLADIPLCYSTPVVLFDKYLVTVGGTQQSSGALSCEVRALNPLTALWKQLACLPAAARLQAVVSLDNKLIVIGGTAEDKRFSDTVWIGIFE